MLEFEKLDWLPAGLKTAMILPENIRTVGTPWFLINPVGFHRFAMSGFPLSGVGQFVRIMKGSVLVMTWPFSVFLDLNVQPDLGLEFMAEVPADQHAKMISKAQFGVFHSKHVVWIPYGFIALTVSLQDGVHAEMLQIPVICSSLCAGMEEVPRNALLKSMTCFQQVIGDVKPWAEISSIMCGWLQACGAVDQTEAAGPEGRTSPVKDEQRAQLAGDVD